MNGELWTMDYGQGALNNIQRTMKGEQRMMDERKSRSMVILQRRSLKGI